MGQGNPHPVKCEENIAKLNGGDQDVWARGREGGLKAQRNKKIRKGFKTLFEEYITDDVADKMVQSIMELTYDKKVAPKDRLKAFELVMRVLGEIDKLHKDDVEMLATAIHLTIA